MAPRTSTNFILTLLVTSLAIFSPTIRAINAHIFADFELPSNLTKIIDSTFYTFNGGRSLVGAPPPTEFHVLLADNRNFPALDGQSVSLAVLQFPGGIVNPPHSHPYATELLLLISGSLQVGFIDTENKLFNQTLKAGDMFVFPKGLVHFQFNFEPTIPAIAVSAFGSSNAGLISLPSNLFTAGIDDTILAQSFKTDIPTIQRLKASVVSLVENSRH